MDSISKLTDQDNLPDVIVDFLDGVKATHYLMERAIQSGSFIEYVCLAASMIDAILRNAIILQKRLINQADPSEEKLLSQTEEGKKILEREIYKNAYSIGIIDKDIFDHLNTLYDARNKCIHRFIISKITYEFVRNVATQYAGIISILKDKLEQIEVEHIRLNTGVLIEDPEFNEDSLVDTYHKMLNRKIDNSNIYNSFI
ncbi:MAG: hypothetical protein IM524_04815 [Pseudanabaena sp. M051S1SP1A06QC]|nr:hypothetical protein [Pseudanabaena sp. M051S1SP1A06QC]